MDDHLAELSSIEGLAPKDAVIGRALIRNNLLAADLVVAAARALAAAAEEGLLERLTYEGHLDSLRAAQIERALEKKLEERKAAQAPSGEAPKPRERFTTPTANRLRMWKPKGKYYRSDESSVVLLNELRERHDPAVEELEDKLAASEAARAELEDRLEGLTGAADEAEIHKASLEAMKAMMETVQSEAERAKEQSSFKEEFIEQLMQELLSEDSRRRELERENRELKNQLTPADRPKAKTAKTKRTNRKKKKKKPKTDTVS